MLPRQAATHPQHRRRSTNHDTRHKLPRDIATKDAVKKGHGARTAKTSRLGHRQMLLTNRRGEHFPSRPGSRASTRRRADSSGGRAPWCLVSYNIATIQRKTTASSQQQTTAMLNYQAHHLKATPPWRERCRRAVVAQIEKIGFSPETCRMGRKDGPRSHLQEGERHHSSDVDVISPSQEPLLQPPPPTTGNQGQGDGTSSALGRNHLQNLRTEVQQVDLRTASTPVIASPPVQLIRMACSTDGHHLPPGPRRPHRVRPLPQIQEPSTTRVKLRQPRRHLPRWPSRLARRLS